MCVSLGRALSLLLPVCVCVCVCVWRALLAMAAAKESDRSTAAAGMHCIMRERQRESK